MGHCSPAERPQLGSRQLDGKVLLKIRVPIGHIPPFSAAEHLDLPPSHDVGPFPGRIVPSASDSRISQESGDQILFQFRRSPAVRRMSPRRSIQGVRGVGIGQFDGSEEGGRGRGGRRGGGRGGGRRRRVLLRLLRGVGCSALSLFCALLFWNFFRVVGVGVGTGEPHKHRIRTSIPQNLPHVQVSHVIADDGPHPPPPPCCCCCCCCLLLAIAIVAVAVAVAVR
mmetsp:Transcript_35672/g.106460  ORF Transcript_35672/g.106460 Transcript_35672/m.106460 type:complete len:225 (-) Transcript_35672:230-904(-)